MGQHISAPKQPSNSTQPIFSKLKTVPYFVFYDGAWWGMLCLAVALILICALLAGLTLAVCGLNMTVLQLRSVTGTPKQRQQALVVARLKRQHTWMLCSLIICSVLCGETLPFVIQSLWDKPEAWVPIVISTLAIGFFAEIAPQYWVPRHAIEWGYYCWPIIWGCMWISCILSWPIAKMLDYCSGANDEVSIFSNDELAGIIKYHERSEKHGGSLSQDTARLMLGALSLDGHRIGANFSPFPETRDTSSKDKDSDIERADLVVTPGMIVNWSAVKTVYINEPIDKAFIKKIASWSYSRIPVVGEAQVELAEPDKNDSNHSSWDSKKIFGFLHIKNLIGLKINDVHDQKTGLFVRDLPLYPLPIVMDDMPAYSLLNMFNLGASRMAVVIRTSPRRPIGEIVIPKKSKEASQCQAPCWTGTERTNTRIKSRLTRMNSQSESSRSYLIGTPTGVENRKGGKPNVIGIRCPEPLGIITFEDIIDTILQKTIRDETDFYDRDNTLPRTKSNKDYGTISIIPEASSENTRIPAYVHDTHLPFLQSKENNILRKRNPSNKERAAATMDGANEHSADTIGTETQVKKNRKDYVESSYTQNSRGGFHGDVEDSESFKSNERLMTPEEAAALGDAPPPTPVNPDSPPKTETVSLPTRKTTSPFRTTPNPADWNPFTRRYVSAMPVLPGLRRVTPFSRQDYSSFEKLPDGENDKSELVMPSPSMVQTANLFYQPFNADASSMDLRPNPLYRQFDANVSGIDITESFEYSVMPGATREHPREDSGDTISVNSWNYGDPHSIDGLNSRVYSASFVASTVASIRDARAHIPANDQRDSAESPRVVPYNGFPPELLDQAKENQVPHFASRTMPRMMGMMGGFDGSNDQRESETHHRESSFHDDRALLPSQRRALNGSAGMSLGIIRRTSFWF